MAAPWSEARHEDVRAQSARRSRYFPAGSGGLQLVAAKVCVEAEARPPGGSELRVLFSGSLCHRLADLRTLVRASSGSSRTWPTVRWAGSSIRSRLRSRISPARWESPSMSRAMDRKVSYWRTL